MYLIGNKNTSSCYGMMSLYYREFTSGLDACGDKIDSIFNEYNALLLSPEYVMEDMFEAGGAKSPDSSNFIARLGKAIRELIQTIASNIKKFMDSFKKEDAKFNKNQALIEAALKKDPDLNKKVMELAKSGALDIHDIKDLNELQDEVDKLLEEKNPKTLKGKFEKLKKKWDDPNVTKTAKRIAFIGAALGLGSAILKFRKDIRENSKAVRELSEKNQKALSDLTDYMAVHEHIDATEMGVLQQKLAIRKWLSGKHGEASAIVQGDYSNVNKGMQRILEWSKNSKMMQAKDSKNRALNAMNLHKGGEQVNYNQKVNKTYFANIAKSMKDDALAYVDTAYGRNDDLHKKLVNDVRSSDFTDTVAKQLSRFANEGLSDSAAQHRAMKSVVDALAEKAKNAYEKAQQAKGQANANKK